MDFKRKIIFAFSFVIILSGCNLVDLAEEKSVNQLEKSGVENVLFKTDSAQVNGYVGGEGECLVFVHGFGGDALLSWRGSLIEFSKNYKVAAFDLQWFGKSNSLYSADLSSQVKMMSLFLENKCKCDSYSLVGHSYGGFVALGYFYAYPNKVEKLVIVNSPGVTYDVNLLKDIEKKAEVENYYDLFVLKKPEEIERLTRMAFQKPPFMPGFLLDEAYDKYFSFHHDELRSLLTTLSDSQEDFLKDSIKFPPSLVILGENDAIFPLAEGEKLAKYMKAKWVIIEDVGHSAPMEDFKSFKKIVGDFLKE